MDEKIKNINNLRRVLTDKLLSIGYPEESINFDWNSNSETYDLAVIEPKTKKLLAVFELIVSGPVVFTSENIREKISKYSRLESDPKVPLYIVSTNHGSTNYAISKILYQTKNSNLPHFIKVEELQAFDFLKKNVLPTTEIESDDFSTKTDEELEGIIRLHENSNIPGSRFQKAMTELDLRYKKRGYQPGIHFEVGGNMTMKGNQILLGNAQMTSTIQGDLVSENNKIDQREIILPKENLLSRLQKFYPVYIIIIILGFVGYFLGIFDFIPKLSTPVGEFKLKENWPSDATSPQQTKDLRDTLSGSVFDFVLNIQELKTELDKEDFVNNNKGKYFKDKGLISEIGKLDSGIWLSITGVTSQNNTKAIECHFEKSWEKALRSIVDMGKKNIEFSGNIQYYTKGWLVADGCKILDAKN